MVVPANLFSFSSVSVEVPCVSAIPSWLLFCSSPLVRVRRQDIDWSKARAEAVQLLQELIRIDTTNPPGNERAAALHIQKLLEAEGIETKVLDVASGTGQSLRSYQR